MTSAEYRALTKNKPNKPVKQHQGSNKGKAPPLQEVRTTGTLDSLNGYSDVKQDVLDKIQELYRQADELLYQIPKERYTLDSPEVYTFLKECRSAMKIVKLLKI